MCSLHPNPGLTGPGPPQVKCDQYWPTRGTETYGLIQVTLLDTVELATYSVRTFALYKVGRTHTTPIPRLWRFLNQISGLVYIYDISVG